MPSNIEGSIKYHFKTVKKFEIVYKSSFSGIPFSFDNLEEFNLNFANQNYPKETHERLYDFIWKHPTILKLEILNLPKVDLPRLMYMLPLVEEFKMNYESSIDDVSRFIKKSKSLKNIEIPIHKFHNTDISDVKVHLGLTDEWHGKKIVYNIFKFTRI